MHTLKRVDSVNPYYRDFSDFLAEHFRGMKMQKLAVNAGFTCPNRDGTRGVGGCTYCNNQSFNPAYCDRSTPVVEQIEEGKAFFARKYPSMRYLAYFQAYTNTHGADIDRLMALYQEAVAVERVDGVIIGTRPDCMPDRLLSRLGQLPWVMVEYGAETSHNPTLDRINRCHTWEETVDAVNRTHSAGIPVGLHFIMGLPGETHRMMLETVDAINSLPVDTVKFHQLQLVRGTRMARDIEEKRYDISRFTVDEYLELCADIVGRLRRDIAIERFVSQSPADLLIYPRWGLKNYEFTARLHSLLKSRGSAEVDSAGDR